MTLDNQLRGPGAAAALARRRVPLAHRAQHRRRRPRRPACDHTPRPPACTERRMTAVPAGARVPPRRGPSAARKRSRGAAGSSAVRLRRSATSFAKGIIDRGLLPPQSRCGRAGAAGCVSMPEVYARRFAYQTGAGLAWRSWFRSQTCRVSGPRGRLGIGADHRSVQAASAVGGGGVRPPRPPGDRHRTGPALARRPAGGPAARARRHQPRQHHLGGRGGRGGRRSASTTVFGAAVERRRPLALLLDTPCRCSPSWGSAVADPESAQPRAVVFLFVFPASCRQLGLRLDQMGPAGLGQRPAHHPGRSTPAAEPGPVSRGGRHVPTSS